MCLPRKPGDLSPILRWGKSQSRRGRGFRCHFKRKARWKPDIPILRTVLQPSWVLIPFVGFGEVVIPLAYGPAEEWIPILSHCMTLDTIWEGLYCWVLINWRGQETWGWWRWRNAKGEIALSMVVWKQISTKNNPGVG